MKPDPVLDWRATREALIARDGQICHYCGSPLQWFSDIEAQCAELYDAVHRERWLEIDEKVTTLRQRHSMQVDHKVSQSQGGSNRLSNLVLSCAQCNTRKGTLAYEEACWRIREKREALCIPPAPGNTSAIVVRRTLVPSGEWSPWYCRECLSSTCSHAQTVTADTAAVQQLWIDYQATTRYYMTQIQEIFQQKFNELQAESSEAIGA